MDIRRVPVDSLTGWKDNPREMSAEDGERLRKQIIMLGVYKPLLVVEETPGQYIVLGGNMRTKIFKELGIDEIEVSVVKAPTQADKIKYAMSDNDRAGAYDQKKLAALIKAERKNIDQADFKVESGWLLPLADLVKLHEDGKGSGPSRPDFTEVVEKFKEGEKQGGKENGNWFYIEYYADKNLFEDMLAILKQFGMIKGRHEIDRNFFAALLAGVALPDKPAEPVPFVKVKTKKGKKVAVEVKPEKPVEKKPPVNINDMLAQIHGLAKVAVEANAKSEAEREAEEAERDDTPPTKEMFPGEVQTEDDPDNPDDNPEGDFPEDGEE